VPGGGPLGGICAAAGVSCLLAPVAREDANTLPDSSVVTVAALEGLAAQFAEEAASAIGPLRDKLDAVTVGWGSTLARLAALEAAHAVDVRAQCRRVGSCDDVVDDASPNDGHHGDGWDSKTGGRKMQKSNETAEVDDASPNDGHHGDGRDRKAGGRKMQTSNETAEVDDEGSKVKGKGKQKGDARRSGSLDAAPVALGACTPLGPGLDTRHTSAERVAATSATIYDFYLKDGGFDFDALLIAGCGSDYGETDYDEDLDLSLSRLWCAHEWRIADDIDHGRRERYFGVDPNRKYERFVRN
jgi:hypothetical protein